MILHDPASTADPRRVVRLAVMLVGGALLLAGCSSSLGSGGGSRPARSDAVVLPAGARVVCANGSAPPCD